MCWHGRTFREEDPHLQVASGQADDGRFVQLGRDGGGQRQQLGQLIEFTVFFLPPSPGGVFRLLLHGVLFTGRVSSSRPRWSGWISVVTIQRDAVPWFQVLAGGEQGGLIPGCVSISGPLDGSSFPASQRTEHEAAAQSASQCRSSPRNLLFKPVRTFIPDIQPLYVYILTFQQTEICLFVYLSADTSSTSTKWRLLHLTASSGANSGCPHIPPLRRDFKDSGESGACWSCGIQVPPAERNPAAIGQPDVELTRRLVSVWNDARHDDRGECSPQAQCRLTEITQNRSHSFMVWHLKHTHKFNKDWSKMWAFF